MKSAVKISLPKRNSFNFHYKLLKGRNQYFDLFYLLDLREIRPFVKNSFTRELFSCYGFHTFSY